MPVVDLDLDRDSDWQPATGSLSGGRGKGGRQSQAHKAHSTGSVGEGPEPALGAAFFFGGRHVPVGARRPAAGDSTVAWGGCASKSTEQAPRSRPGALVNGPHRRIVPRSAVCECAPHSPC